MTWTSVRNSIIKYESSIYLSLSAGIVVSLLYWTLLNSILSISLAGFWLIFSKKSFNAASLKGQLVIIFCSLFIINVIGLFYTANLSEGLFRVQQKSALLLFPVVFGTTEFADRDFLQKMNRVLLISTSTACTISFIIALFKFLATGNLSMLFNKDLTIFDDIYPYLIGVLCIQCINFLLSNLENSRSKKIWPIILVAFLSCYIMILSNRIVILFWIILISFYLCKRIKNILLIAGSFSIALAFVTISIVSIPSLKTQWKELTTSSKTEIVLDKDSSLGRSWGGATIRVAIWKCTGDLIRNHWLAGLGTGDVQDSLQQAYENRKFYFASRYNKHNSHNQYIQTLLGQGIFGLSSLILSIIAPVIALRKQAGKWEYYFFLALFAILSITEVILDTNKGIIWYSFFNSIFVSGILSSDSKNPLKTIQ